MARGGDVAEIVAECGQAMWPVQGWKLGLLAWEYGGGSGKIKKNEGERRDVHKTGNAKRPSDFTEGKRGGRELKGAVRKKANWCDCAVGK